MHDIVTVNTDYRMHLGRNPVGRWQLLFSSLTSPYLLLFLLLFLLSNLVESHPEEYVSWYVETFVGNRLKISRPRRTCRRIAPPARVTQATTKSEKT